MADDIKPRIRVPTTAKKGEVIEIKTLITHAMETGQRKDADGKLVPRLIVNTLAVTYNGKPVLNAKLEPAISANPYLSFFVKVEESGTLEFTWKDDDGRATRPRARSTLPSNVIPRSSLGARHSRARHALRRSRHWSGAPPAHDARSPRAGAARGRDGGAGREPLRRGAAAQLTQEDLLRFEPLGQVTLLHFTDIHAQLLPLHFREPSVNIGVGEDKGLPPHLVGAELLEAFKLGRGTAEAYALACTDFAALARPTAGSAASTAWRHWSRRSAPSAAARCCCSTAATPGRAPTPPSRARAPTWCAYERARRRGDDRALGIHLRRRARQGAGQGAQIPVPRRQREGDDLGRSGVRAPPPCSSAAA